MKMQLAASRAEARWHKRKGRGTIAFTLIELLVVIGIIAILAALLLPSLNRAKQEGNTVACKSNLRQLGIALSAYVSDFNFYPIYNVTHEELSGPPPATWWHQTLEPFTHAIWDTNVYRGAANSKNGLYLCPSQARLVSNPTFSTDYWPAIGSYGINDHGVAWGLTAIRTLQFMGIGGGFVQANPASTSDFLATRESQVVRPSLMVAMGDAALGADGTGWALLDSAIADNEKLEENPNPSPAEAAMLGKRRQRHGGRWNVLFCDGHVQDLKTRALFDYHQDEVLQQWNYDNLPHRELIP